VDELARLQGAVSLRERAIHGLADGDAFAGDADARARSALRRVVHGEVIGAAFARLIRSGVNGVLPRFPQRYNQARVAGVVIGVVVVELAIIVRPGDGDVSVEIVRTHGDL